MIKKYDNFFPPHIQTRIFGYIITSNYAIGWDDSTEVQHRAHPNLHRRFILEKDSEWWLNPILECVLPKLTDKNILSIRGKIKSKLINKNYLTEMIIESILEKCIIHNSYISLYLEF